MAEVEKKHMVHFKQWECEVVKLSYQQDDSIALQLINDPDGPIATATVYLKDLPLKGDLVWIKTWSENEGIFEALEEAGIIMNFFREVDVNGFGSKAKLAKVLI